MASKPEFLLHTYYKSSCAARLRIALNLKSIPAEYAYVHLFNGEQYGDEHAKLNPSKSVPVLTHLAGEGIAFPITQSMAALEYLEEVFPDQCPLLPPVSQPLQRAKVRTLVDIITNDVQPITNRRIIKAVTDLGGDSTAWNKHFMTRGLEAYETVASKTAGKFSVGDEVSMADVCLVPAIWAAEKNGVAREKIPIVMRVYTALSELGAVQKAHWSRQEDTPADMAWL